MSLFNYAFATFLISSFAHAQGIDFPQCQTSVLGPQKIQSQSQNLPDAQRVIELEQLLQDFRSIRQNLSSVKRLPTGYVNSCIESKMFMVEAHFTKLNETTQKSHRVLKVMAQLLEVNFKPSDAIKFYDAAFAANSSDTDSALRSLQITATVEFDIYSKNQKAMTKDQKIAVLSALLDKGYAIANSPKFSTEERMWALEQVQGVLAANDIRPKVEEAYWRKLLDIDPKSDKAIRELVNMYELRADYGKMSIYATKLSESGKVQNSDVAKIGLALSKAEDYSALLKVGNDLIKKFPDNAESWGYLGVAEQKLKLYDKAEANLEKAISMKSANPAFKTSFAALQEEQGDRAAQDKNWIDAMSKYREALKFNPNSSQLKKKTAYLILDYNTEAKFPKNASTKMDMDFALDLMTEAISSKVPLMADYAAAIRLAAHSSTPAKHRNLCDRYQTDRPSGLSIDIVRSCVSIYRAAGQEGKAKGIVDVALSKVKDGEVKQEFLKTLR